MNVIAVDAMGGDRAPSSEVAGAVAAVKQAPVKVILCGDRDAISTQLEQHQAAEGNNLEIRHATQVVTMDDSPWFEMVPRSLSDFELKITLKPPKTGQMELKS